MTRYVHKQIHNARLYKPSDQRAFRRLMLILLLIIGVAGSLIYATWQHVEALRLGYRTDQLVRERDRREAEKRQLELERAYQRSPQVIEELARRLGMIRPDSSKVIVIGGKPRPVAVMERSSRPATISDPPTVTHTLPSPKRERRTDVASGVAAGEPASKTSSDASASASPASAPERTESRKDAIPPDQTTAGQRTLKPTDEADRASSPSDAEITPPKRKRPSKQGDPQR
ncbi:MAG TPA: cell division protein FtsL [Blastocatellia bacterium]|nr:cell division protein FtsL [Blastocatellia bacterium]